MRRLILACTLALAGCVPARPEPAPLVPAAVQTARSDVEKYVVERFGTHALHRARTADGFIAVLRYPGLPMPPYDTDGHPIKPSYPTALLFLEHGRWFAYGIDGVHPVLSRWAAPLEELLRDRRLWAEPIDGGVLGCTDAGASYAWLRVPGHAEQVRIGHCGGSPLTEQLVSAALMG